MCGTVGDAGFLNSVHVSLIALLFLGLFRVIEAKIRFDDVVKKVLACSDMADRSVVFPFGSAAVLSAVEVVVCVLLVAVVVLDVCVGVEVLFWGAGGVAVGGSDEAALLF